MDSDIRMNADSFCGLKLECYRHVMNHLGIGGEFNECHQDDKRFVGSACYGV